MNDLPNDFWTGEYALAIGRLEAEIKAEPHRPGLQPDALSYLQFARIEGMINRDTVAYFRLILDSIINHGIGAPPISISSQGGQPTANIRIRRRLTPARAYEIKVCPAFGAVMDTVVELYAAGNVIVSAKGEMRQPMDLTTEEHIASAREAVLGYLRGATDLTLSAGLRRSALLRLEREIAVPDFQRQNHSLSFLRRSMVLFILAHEIGHVHGKSEGVDATPEQEEIMADGYALELLLNRMVHFPPGFIFEAWFGENAAAHRLFWRISTLNAIAVLCALYGMIETGARSIGIAWGDNYPSARTRFDSIRETCLSTGYAKPADFSEMHTLVLPPDKLFANYERLSMNIRW